MRTPRILHHLVLVWWGVEGEGLAALVDGEVAQAVWSGGELTPGMLGQPDQCSGV